MKQCFWRFRGYNIVRFQKCKCSSPESRPTSSNRCNNFADLHLHRSGSHCRRAESFIVSQSPVCLSVSRESRSPRSHPSALIVCLGKVFVSSDAEDPQGRYRMFHPLKVILHPQCIYVVQVFGVTYSWWSPR